MFSRQHSTVCDIKQYQKKRPAPIRVSPWKETPKGEVEVKKFDKKGCGERTQFCMEEYHP